MRYSFCSLNIFLIIVATIAKDDEGVSGKGVLSLWLVERMLVRKMRVVNGLRKNKREKNKR